MSTPSTNSKGTWRFKVLVVFITGVLLFLVVEVGLRIKGDTYSWSENVGWPYHSWYTPYPCMDYWVLQQDHTYNEPEFDYAVNLNSLGIRDVEHTVGKDSATFRVVAMGDSFTEGVGAPFDSTWLSQFGRKYQPAGYDSVEVISGGVRSSYPIFEYKLFHDQLAAYDPDVVFWVVNQTDVMEYFIRGGFEQFYDDTCHYKQAPAMEAVFKRSHVVRSFMLNVLGYNWQLFTPMQREEMWQYFIRDVKTIADSVHRMGERQGFVNYFVFHPMDHEVRDQRYEFDFHLLMRELEEVGVQTIDIYEMVNNETHQGDSLSLIYWPRDRHFKPYGYGKMAEYISNQLSKN